MPWQKTLSNWNGWPGEQIDLIKSVYATGRRTVLAESRPPRHLGGKPIENGGYRYI